MALVKSQMDQKGKKEFERKLTKSFTDAKYDTKQDLLLRVNGVPARAGATGYQFAGYTRLERFYRGDQWTQNEPPGASQKTDNYCAVIVDNLSSLIFDDTPDINCPTNDPSDDILQAKAELKEELLHRVWKDNDSKVEFDEWSKVASLYGDGFLKGPYMEKDRNGKWVIRFHHVENPGAIQVVWADGRYKKILSYIDTTRISLLQANKLWGTQAAERGIVFAKEIHPASQARMDRDTSMPMVSISEYCDDEVMAWFINDKLLDYDVHNWGFVPLRHVKNNYVPNHPYGKSDLEDALDPQMAHNRMMNDLANFLRWISSINFWGKNLEGMEALVAGLSRIYSLPEDGELHTFEKPGDPYIANTVVQQRRTAILDVSGLSDALLSSSQNSASSGRALALAFQGTIRKLNPRMKRFASCLEDLNSDILRLYEIYFPETKKIIEGDYRNEVFISATILRNIVDTINKLQSGVISLDTAQKEAGVARPKMEQKVMRKNLEDPVLGPQIARQPQLLPRLQEGQNQPGEQPMQAPGNRVSSPQGAPAANNQNASGAAPTPITP